MKIAKLKAIENG